MNALVRERALSAHETFKDQYALTLRWSVLGALALLVVAVLVMPEYAPTPYRLQQDEFEIIDMEPIAPPIDPPERREIPSMPNLEPAPPDEPYDDFPDYRDLLPVPPSNPGWTEPAFETPFVAVSEKPRLVQGATADYPEMARLAGMQGTVVVKVEVDVDGTVSRVEILKGVHPLLDRPALAAARKLRFSPGTQQGMPVRCFVAVPFRFYLH